MLVAFSVENYRSFKGRVTLSMVAADLSSKPKELDSTNVFQARAGLSLLTSAALYGANASGKSNLVAALIFMRNLVLNSSRETRLRQPVNVTPYRLNTDTEQAPSRFEIVFVQRGVIYRYGFVVSRKQIVEEWLYSTNKKEGYLFERDSDFIKVNERSFKEGQGLQERTRPNALFLSVAAQWNGKRSGEIVEWFEKLAVNAGVDSEIAQRRIAQKYGEDEISFEGVLFVQGLDLEIEDIHIEREFVHEVTFRDIVSFVQGLDLGIEDMRIERDLDHEVTFRDEDGIIQTEIAPGSTHIRTIHSKYDSKGNIVANEQFDLFTDESQGTRRLFTLAEPILAALRTGTVC